MITGYNFVTRTATFQSTDKKKKWTVRIGLIKIQDGSKERLFDMGNLLMYRKISGSNLNEDIRAGIALIESWPEFEEKQELLDVCIAALAKRKEQYRFDLSTTLREVYGISTGSIIARGIAYGKLEKHADNIVKRGVVELVKFLLNKTSTLAMMTFPSPKSEIGAIRACQSYSFSKPYMAEMKKLVAGMESFDIFTSFRVASYIEKVTQPRTGYKSGTSNKFNQLEKGLTKWGSK